MRIVGFNFTKISAEKFQPIVKPNLSTNIKFLEVSQEKEDLLKGGEIVKVTFSYNLTYDSSEKKDTKQGDINFEGRIFLSVDQEESKDLMKAWKKKDLSPNLKLFLYNFILKKCTPKAVYLQDEIELPSHVPMPRLKPQNNQQ